MRADVHNLTFLRKFYRPVSNISKASSNPSTIRQLERLNLPLFPGAFPSSTSGRSSALSLLSSRLKHRCRQPFDYRHLPQYYAVYFAAKISRIRFAASEGVLPTFTPAASRASFFA